MSTLDRVLVTGATGCLGAHLVERLLQRGASVRALVRESSRTQRLEDAGVAVQRGSLLDDEDLKRAVEGVGAVFHLGGLVIDDRPDDTSEELWNEIRRHNVEGTERLARLAAAAGVERFIFASSVRIFGFGSQMLWREDDPRTPSDLYSRGKILAEEALARVGQETGLGVVNIRPRFIYGNGDRYVLPRIVQAVQKGRTPMVRGGDAICDIVYAKDCAEAMILAAERDVSGEAYNITSGECLRLRDIFNEVARAMGKPIRFISIPAPAAFAAATAAELGSRAIGRQPPISRAALKWYTNDHHFSIDKARKELGYQPRYPLREALKEIDLQQFAA